MNTNVRNTLIRLIATLAVLSMLPIGVAVAQAPEPPPPAVPFDAGDMPLTDSGPAFAPKTPPVGDSFQNGADRLTEMQWTDGSWGWPLIAPPTYANILGPIAMGLERAFGHTGDPTYYAALELAGDYLLGKVNNFSPSDGYLAQALDQTLGTTDYTTHVNTYFYGPLAAGNYDRNGLGVLYDTEGYVNLVRTNRAGLQANLAAWDLGMGLVGAIASGVDGDDKDAWIAGVKAEVNELDADGYYDVIGLAGAVYGLAEAEQQDFDPTSGEHALAGNLSQLGMILASYQLPSGGWTWNANYQVPDDGNETIQETAYAILALSRLNWENFLPNMIWGADYIFDTQLGTGGWEDYVGGGENNEVTGEALWGIATAYRGNEIWVCETGDCGHPEMSFNNIQDAVNAAEWGGVVHVLAGTYSESVTISKNVHLIGAGMGALSMGTLIGPASIIQAPPTLPDASQQGSAILIVDGGDNVEITGFTVTGPGPSSGGSIRYGIFVRDGAHAKIHDNLIQDIRDDVLPLSGCQNGVGIGVGRQAWGLSGDAEIVSNTIVGYQKGAIVVDNAGSFAHIEGNTITGIGTTDITAENGIQISRGATATLLGNTVTGHSFHLDGNPSDWGSAGLLIGDFGFGPGTEVSFAGPNTFSDNDVNVYSETAIGQWLDALTLGGSSAPAGIGMDIWNDGTGTMDATIATFTGATTCPEIENRVYHAMDDPALGLVTWEDGVLCVTPDTAGIQAGIDASSAGDTIHVYPGTYDETAADRTILDGTPAEQGPHQFGLFFPITKPGLTVMGVNPDGSPITDAGDPDLPYVTTNATNNFGPSNFWVEGANVTIQGLRQGPNASGENKSIEVVGDGFTLRYFKSDLPDGGGAVYFNDWLYDIGTDTSTIGSFHVMDSNFDDGTQIAVASGTGFGSPVGGRTITGNSFEFNPLIGAGWPAISFSGSGTDVPWFVHPVGGAVISGNSFSGSTSYIRSRGTVQEVDFDWASYWNGNTFDKKVMAGPTPPSQPRAYSYMSGSYNMPNTRIIGALIQPEIDHAIAGDMVLVSAGTFAERLDVNEPITLAGAGVTESIIDAAGFGTAGNVIDITALTGDTTIQGFDILTGDHSNGIHFAGGTDAGGSINILDNHIISTNFGSDQFGIIGGYMDVRAVTITGNEISNTYDNSILAELQMGATEISGNTFNGAFPSVFFMTYDGHDVTPLQKVSDNTFDMSLAEVGSGAAGVGVNPSTYYVETSRRNGKYADFEISGNTFTGIADLSIKAISIGENSEDGATGGFDNLQIFANTISGTGGKGIQFFGHVTNASVYNNVITGLYQGLKMFSVYSSYWPEGNDISCNQVTGASDKLVYWDGADPLNVEFNWWGAVLGPNPLKMSANVDYKPWLTTTLCGGGTYPPFPTTTNITSSPRPSFDTDLVTIDITVTDAVGGGPVPVGTVDVGYPGLDPIPACTNLALDGLGEATCSYTFPHAGGYTLTASFTPTDTADFTTSSGELVHKVWLTPVDFDGDGDTDVSIYRPLTGSWSVKDGLLVNYGLTGDLPIPGDYNGDGITDVAVYRPSTGTWYIKDQFYANYGLPGDVPIPGDYDGNGTTDLAVFRPSEGHWYVKDQFHAGYALPGDVPIPGDYNGDGTTDLAVFRPSEGHWYVRDQFHAGYALPGDIPIPGDYNGDGTTDLAVYRPSEGHWYVKDQFHVSYGLADDIPVPGDYDGDQDTDVAIYRPAGGSWAVMDQFFVNHGLPGDYPLPAPDTNADGDPYQ